jgi:TatD DNase family protein
VLVDTHTHLSCPDFEEDRDEALARALEVCDYLIDIGAGTSPDSHLRAKSFAETNQRVYFTSGVHPHDAEKLGMDSEMRQSIESLLSHPKCVAVGECGLDYFYDHSPSGPQKEVFKWQIELAEKTGLPLSIHTREAEEDTKTLLESYKGQAVFHCFTSSLDLAKYGIEKGFMISFSGIVTFKKAEELREVCKWVPLENLLLETDAPYLAPIPKRGKRNEPSFIQHTAKFIAELKSIDENELIAKTTENAKSVFQKISA